MKRKNGALHFCGAIFALIAVVFVSVHQKETALMFASIKGGFQNAASVFFVDSVTKTDLLARYDLARNRGEKVKIIIVAGHDDDRAGAIYKGRREADMNMELAEKLAGFFQADSEFETVLVRTSAGYNPTFWNYRENGKDSLSEFIKSKKLDMQKLIASGSVHDHDGVRHNKAPGETITTLYSINRWANEDAADLVLHIHFNDAADRKGERPWEYSGFSIYIPERQYSNARASRSVAEPVFARLSKFSAVSNLPKEDAGIVESQDLIAVGAYNTLDVAGMLIEYGYIYEPQFDNTEVRGETISELAWQTYLGLHDFFRTKKSKRLASVGFLEDLKSPIDKNTRDKAAILNLQKALLSIGAYPSQGKNLRDCPLSGNFGDCTETALHLFQARENITDEKSGAGELTLKVIDERLRSLGL